MVEIWNFFTLNKSGRHAKYNFDLEKLMSNFSFYDLCCNTKEGECSGFLVITNYQYLLGYNEDNGYGPHLIAFARAMKDIKGGGDIQNHMEVEQLYDEIKEKYIIGRISFENNYGEISSHLRTFEGNISIDFGSKRISLEQYMVFKKFYDDYNDEIKAVSAKYHFKVDYLGLDNEGVIINHTSDSLDDALKYARRHLVYTSNIPEEVILDGSKSKKRYLINKK